MLFVRLATNYVNRPSNWLPERTRCWRGSKLEGWQARALRPGRVYRPPMFIASSRDLNVAVEFLPEVEFDSGGRARRGQRRYVVQLNIPSQCPNACLVDGTMSEFSEDEILLPPYTPLLVVAPPVPLVRHTPAYEDHQMPLPPERDVDGVYVIVVDVLDGAAEFENERQAGEFARVWPI